MKHYFVLILFGLLSRLSYGQSPVVYGYDAAGNRIVKSENPLPVTLIYFKAEKLPGAEDKGPSAHLDWQTSFETNSDYFEIQRSNDGKIWSEIGVVRAGGERISNTYYSFEDENPLEGENIYRLKMVDQDGTFALSRLQSLNFDAVIVFYPNPVKDVLLIRGVFAKRSQDLNVYIYDLKGRLVKAATGISDEGIDMAALPTGIYTVKILQADGVILVRKVVKQ